jgi:hypothetical protein
MLVRPRKESVVRPALDLGAQARMGESRESESTDGKIAPSFE